MKILMFLLVSAYVLFLVVLFLAFSSTALAQTAQTNEVMPGSHVGNFDLARAQGDTTGLTTSMQSCPDTYEPNEHFYQAIALTPGNPIQSYICDDSDRDWFKFTVVAGNEITVDLTNLPDDYDLFLYKPDDPYTAVGDSNHSETTDEQIIHTVTMSGDYRVQVIGWSSLNFDPDNPYTLLVQISGTPPAPTPTATGTSSPTPTATETLIATPTATQPGTTSTVTPTPTATTSGTPPACSDSYEPNESFQAPITITPGNAIQSYICDGSDRDWFRFTAAIGQEITVYLLNLPTDYDLALYMPDDPSTMVGYSGNFGTITEQIIHTATMSGDYRIQVLGWSTGASDPNNPYTLLVQLDISRIYVPLILKQ